MLLLRFTPSLCVFIVILFGDAWEESFWGKSSEHFGSGTAGIGSDQSRKVRAPWPGGLGFGWVFSQTHGTKVISKSATPPFWWLKSLILGEAWGDSKCYVNVNYADVYIYIHFLQNKFDVFNVLCGCTGAIACWKLLSQSSFEAHVGWWYTYLLKKISLWLCQI